MNTNLTLYLTGFPYFQVYLNHQKAAAHQLILERIEAIILEDTGKMIQWWHLHAKDLNDDCGILHWVADQHGGQAKGEVCNYLINAAGGPKALVSIWWSWPKHSQNSMIYMSCTACYAA